MIIKEREKCCSRGARSFYFQVTLCFSEADLTDGIKASLSSGFRRWWLSLSCVQLLRPHGLKPSRLLYPWNSPGKNPGVGCHSLLQGIFPTQGLNPGLLNCRQILYHLKYLGNPSVACYVINKQGMVSLSYGKIDRSEMGVNNSKGSSEDLRFRFGTWRH